MDGGGASTVSASFFRIRVSIPLGETIGFLRCDRSIAVRRDAAAETGTSASADDAALDPRSIDRWIDQCPPMNDMPPGSSRSYRIENDSALSHRSPRIMSLFNERETPDKVELGRAKPPGTR